MRCDEVGGRFLPSRVYCRWKWTVRFGLLIVPFLVFLSGALLLFLTPNRYRSTTLVELENGPPVNEALELLTERPTLERVIDRLKLNDRWSMDRETLVESLRKTVSAKLVDGTQLVRVTVKWSRNSDARDIADEIPKALLAYLEQVREEKLADQFMEFDRLIAEASDDAEKKAALVVGTEKVHGPDAGASPTSPLARARRASMLADAELERIKALKNAARTDLVASRPRLVVHEQPVITSTPDSPKIGPGLNQWVIKALLVGLLTALLLPYLFELAFPPAKVRPGSRTDDDF
jgi:hypothetical protein